MLHDFIVQPFDNKLYLLTRIYGVHDEAKDKAFELEMSWVCDESNRQHQKVNQYPSKLNFPSIKSRIPFYSSIFLRVV